MPFTQRNIDALTRQEIYSSVILDELRDDNFLTQGLHRNVTDFPDGDVIKIATAGEVVLRDIEKGQPLPIDNVDSGRIELAINRFRGGGASINDVDLEDSWMARQFDAMTPGKLMTALRENYEADLLATSEYQTQGDPNAINGYAHRFVASGTGQTVTVDDFIYAKLAADKIGASGSRILIVDPVVEATLNGLTNLVNVSNNPRFEGMVETGFAKNFSFIKNIYGWDVYVSNRLPKVASETVDTTGLAGAAPSGSASVTDGVVNQFIIGAGDDMVTPYMGAWRRMPRVKYERQESLEQDNYYLTARWGFGMQRPQSLFTMLTSESNY